VIPKENKSCRAMVSFDWSKYTLAKEGGDMGAEASERPTVYGNDRRHCTTVWENIPKAVVVYVLYAFWRERR
jgi:hypothetical protein